VIRAAEIARALELPPPTPQQVAVIEAELAPALVIAGAGSGKTETMANRVLWLLANERVRASEILGLTFTRKAAGELLARIRERVTQLAAAGLVPDEHDPFEAAEVATYNSFANSIFRDNAILVGRESDGAVLGEAGAWQLARAVVTRSAHPALPDLDKNLDPVVGAVLELSRSMAENLARPEEVRAYAARFAATADLPLGGKAVLAAEEGIAATVGTLDVLLDLAAEYEAAKFERSLVEYSDQVALALEIVGRQERVGAEYRERYRVVLLDEYQDTSVVQTRLLAALFGGTPVMAVGDPNQSIYGWRGASASNLEQFAGQFGATGAPFALTTSWRNGTRILDAANALVAPFARTSRIPVERLVPAPQAGHRDVDVVFAEDLEHEAAEVAEWFARRVGTIDHPLPKGRAPSAALLMRARRTQPVFLAALRERGVRTHVLGIGGLLAEPEVADIVCMLAVLGDAEAGLELLRLLAGSRWRIGVQDLHALRRVSSWLREHDHKQQLLGEELEKRVRATVTEGESGSIVDALDFVAHTPDGHRVREWFSPVGLERLVDAGLAIARLRGRIALPLPDLVAVVEHELQLDIEVVANETRTLGGAGVAALLDAVDGYLALEDRASLRWFLAWLRAAEEKEDLSPRPEDPVPGTVQVLTIHGAKGLEWDAVAIPRMVADELPMKPVEGLGGWLSFGKLPWPFRGDAADLPFYAWEAATTRAELAAARRLFRAAVQQRFDDEERRLAYVAVTRARHDLLLSGSFWATQVKWRSPSPLLAELADAGVIPPPPDRPASEVNPMGEGLETFTWPRDPLGATRRPLVMRAAELVRAAEPVLAGGLAEQVQTLLVERERRLAGRAPVIVPARVPASRFKDFVSGPDEVALALLRPMPEKPYRATRLGTVFHAWVEQRYGIVGGSDELDAELLELDDAGDPVDADELARLQAIFEASEWASRRPVEVEREIHLPFDGRIVICKIDAIYESEGRYEVVDWKTGKKPRDAADERLKRLQLALYRLAYAKWSGVDPSLIDAAFYFVADDHVLRPEHVESEDELLALWRAAFGDSVST
jgi:DNA helicase-2/ATP-dependent DNA helicase PcrA